MDFDEIFAWLVRLRDSNFIIQDSETRFIFFKLEIPRIAGNLRRPSFFKHHSVSLLEKWRSLEAHLLVLGTGRCKDQLVFKPKISAIADLFSYDIF